MKLFDSELKVMEIIWKGGDMPAKKIAEVAKYTIGWSKTTTYTVIKKCIEKQAIERRDPHFLCHPLVDREEVQEMETDELIHKMFDGKADLLVANIVSKGNLSSEELEKLQQMISQLRE